MRSRYLSMLILLLLFPAVSIGAENPADEAGVVEHIFAAADLDADGVLTEEEYDNAGLFEFGVSFEACDADHDGRLTASEYLIFYRIHHPPAQDLEV